MLVQSLQVISPAIATENASVVPFLETKHEWESSIDHLRQSSLGFSWLVSQFKTLIVASAQSITIAAAAVASVKSTIHVLVIPDNKTLFPVSWALDIPIRLM